METLIKMMHKVNLNITEYKKLFKCLLFFSDKCNLKFTDSEGDDCKKYKEDEWCTADGEYGKFWDDKAYYGKTKFEDFSKVQAVNGVKQNALVCPECGCKEGKYIYTPIVSQVSFHSS